MRVKSLLFMFASTRSMRICLIIVLLLSFSATNTVLTIVYQSSEGVSYPKTFDSQRAVLLTYHNSPREWLNKSHSEFLEQALPWRINLPFLYCILHAWHLLEHPM